MAAGFRDELHRLGAAGMSWTRRLLLAAVLVGLVTMHQLAGAATISGHHGGHQETGSTSHRALVDPGPSPDVPPGQHGHPGQVCQPTPPGHAAGAPVPLLAVLPGGPAPVPPGLSARTVAHDAARGTGCGPPARSELSLWRI